MSLSERLWAVFEWPATGSEHRFKWSMRVMKFVAGTLRLGLLFYGGYLSYKAFGDNGVRAYTAAFCLIAAMERDPK